MPTLLSSIETQARRHLHEPTARFWSSDELIDIINQGRRDLWRDIADLKQEHYLTMLVDEVSLEADESTMTGVPEDIHKIYLIEPSDTTTGGTSENLIFKPLDYNHKTFQAARSRDPIEPNNDTIYYALRGQGGPTGDGPTIDFAPQVTSQVLLRFVYVPTLEALASDSNVDIPGEADNALIAWTVAFARAKEREDRAPDSGWLAIYATEKQHLLQSLGLRQYQEPTYVDGLHEDYWN